MKKNWVSAFLLTLSVALTACGGGGQSTTQPTDKPAEPAKEAAAPAAPARENVLIVAADQDPVGLDPHKIPAASSARIYGLIYDGLTKMDPEFNVIPNLATKWEFSEDGKTLTFHLQPGVKFHNGREMTSEDVKYSFERILNPDTGSTVKSFFASIEAIETPDANTVVFKLTNPDSAIVANTSSAQVAIVPKEVADLNTEAVGTGPFMMEKMESGQYVQLKKNPNYFKDGLPKADGIKFTIMKDEAQRTAAIRSGKIDIASVNADTAMLLEKTPALKIESYQSAEYGYLGINTAKKPFDNPKVRQAISYAVNRDEIVQTVWKGQAELTGPISPAQKSWAVDTSSFASYKHDVAKAKELLKEAGLADGFKTTLYTASTYPDMIESAQVIQQQLKAIGIDAQINQLEWAAYIEMWKSKDTDLLVGRNTSGTDPDRSMRFFFSTTGSANVWNYSNPAYDEIVQKALETTDPAGRKELYNQAQQMLVEDAPNLFLASPKNFYAVSEQVDGFVPTAAGEAFAIVRASIK
ncbi:ABC transporter substrate-binding protein [Ammoniphilus sp. CFH 90114]|uniref:ABC transporter substrate-binding protein n=1 Tax=Ammoniphilus sp. CFH 90114 TaxID=2493665 RepID=UPI00100DC9C4|nr:ABC transporter substrate-binding protein [Ammoniphilus sp. CFH 90114]RXT04297.1 ABC transporter substrate-binding protein [Ammoniphilus sp. CFH 90114]